MSHSIVLKSGQFTEAVRSFHSFHGTGVRTAGLKALEEILSFFSQFPYENISKIIKYQHHFEGPEKIRLPDEVMEDHARYRLGGTCFSLTFFLKSILEEHGYVCYPVMADMRWGKNVHCAMIVVLDGRKYLVDPGYLLNQPMEIADDKPRLYKTDVTGVELVRGKNQTYELYTFDRRQMKWRYRFHDRPVPPEEFLEHWLASFSWNSMHGLCLTKVEKDRMVYVHKTHMRETTFEGKRNINIKSDVHGAIHRSFGISEEIVEEALAAIEENMTRERELGLYIPKKEWRPAS